MYVRKSGKLACMAGTKKGMGGEGEKSPKGKREREKTPTNSLSNLIMLTVNT